MPDAHTTHVRHRYWVPRPALATLDDAGFLVDPEGKWGPSLSPGAVALSSLDAIRVLVLLGEPGMGKSTEVAADAERLRTLGGASETVLHVDLREYESVVDLRDAVFRGPEVTAWRLDGTSRLTLTFDSLDEGLLTTSQLADGLARELAALARDPALNVRLRVRIACRTAVWPDSAEMKLRAAWGDEHVLTCVLAPLRRVDVAASLRDAGIPDADVALHDLLERGVGALAARPVTLNFLTAALREGAIPASQVGLYAQGCLRLADESNAGRVQSGKMGTCSARERLAIAAPAAALTVFGNRAALRIGPVAATAGVTRQELELDEFELIGGEEPVRQADDSKAGETRVVVNRESVRDTLDTALFHAAPARVASSGAPLLEQVTRLGWAHWSFAEFLAARWVHVNGLTAPQQDQLFLTHATGGARVVPQLRQTAAWLAGHDAEFRRRLMRLEPEVVLGSDIEMADSTDRARIVETLIEMARSGEFVFRHHMFAEFRALAHPGLVGQLVPVITDAAEPVPVRALALRLGGLAGVAELAATAAAVVLDEESPGTLRYDAMWTLGSIGTPAELALVRPLLVSAKLREQADASVCLTADIDPYDQLRGEALRALWPKQLSAEELFAALIPPKRSNYIGSYAAFLRQLAEQIDERGLDDDALVVALRWHAAASVAGRSRRSENAPSFGSVRAAVLRAAWRRFRAVQSTGAATAPPPAALVEQLAAVSARALMTHEPLVDDHGMNDFAAALGDTHRRRAFLAALVRVLAEAIRETSANGAPKDGGFFGASLFRRCSVPGEDAEWLVEELRAATDRGDDDAAAIWIAVLVPVAMWAGEAAFDVVYCAAYGPASTSLHGESPDGASSDGKRGSDTSEDVDRREPPTIGGESAVESVDATVGTVSPSSRVLPALARALDPLVKAIDLESPEAQSARNSYESLAQLEAQRCELDAQVANSLSIIGRSAHESASKVLAGDIDEWWRLNHWLSWSEDGHLEEHDSSLTGRPLWGAFDAETRAGLVLAAAKYVNARDDGHLGWNEPDGPDRPAMAGFRALRLLQDLDVETYVRLPTETWRRWAWVIVSYPIHDGGDRPHFYDDLLARAYAAAPDVIADAVACVAAAEDARHGTPFVLNRVANVWSTGEGGAALGETLLAKVRERLASGSDTPTCKGLAVMLSALIEHSVSGARELAEALVRDAQRGDAIPGLTVQSAAPATDSASDSPAASSRAIPAPAIEDVAISRVESDPEDVVDTGHDSMTGPARTYRERAIAAAEALVRSTADASWGLIWPLIASEQDFATTLLLNLAGHGQWPNGVLTELLDESAIAALHIRMVELFPVNDRDDDHEGARWVTSRDEAVRWRDGLLQHLAELGTPAALEALREIRARFPERLGLAHLEREAQTSLRRATWVPATPAELLLLARGGRYRIVQTERDLADAVVDSLARFVEEVRGPNATIEQFWDEIPDPAKPKASLWRPKDEETLSNALAAHLTRELSPGGFTTVREVRLRPARGDTPAEDIDIYVDAIVDERTGRRHTVTVLLEVKGQWFKQLASSIKNQLVERYLSENPVTATGVFVVGWYLCPEWDPKHYQRRDAEQNATDRETFAAELDAEATALSIQGRDVRAVVLDLSLSR